ncbi:MAG: T9SS type A sorting domain-containing protein [Sphingobacteriales bacterium]|nr:MAG: T9SS type A sorting domain-containing protein [Sphingobacteriales bacterium]
MRSISLLAVALLWAHTGFAQIWQFTIKKAGNAVIEIYGRPDYTDPNAKINTIGGSFGIPTSSYGATMPGVTFTPNPAIFSTYSSNPLQITTTDIPGVTNWAFYVESTNPPTTPLTAGTEYLIGTAQFGGSPGNPPVIASLYDDPTGLGGVSGNTAMFINSNQGNNYDNSTPGALFYQTSGANGTNTPTTQLTFNRLALANGVSLPVSLLAFNASRNAKTVELKWTVGQEENLSHYTVERSLNGRTFENVIATVKASGLTAYSTTDAQPATGANYYRLKMVDVSGTVKYSEIREVDFNNVTLTATAPVLFPNPAMLSTTLEYNAPEAFTATIQVYDVMGKLVQQQQADFHVGVNQHAIDVAGLAPGHYMILLKGGSIAQMVKFQKAN